MKAINLRVLGAEAIGTAILIVGGPGSAVLAGDKIGMLGVSLAFGFSLLIAAYLVGAVSGCHINPAVTLAMWLTKKVSGSQAITSVVGQAVGGFAGGFIVLFAAGGSSGYYRGGFAANGWAQLSSRGSNVAATIFVEIVFTALLVLVVLGTTNKKFPAAMAPVAAGLTLTLIHLVTIPVDNTSVNPIRSLVTAAFADRNLDYLQQVWVFLLFPLVGAVLGVVLWLIIDEERLEATLLDNPQTRYSRDQVGKVAHKVTDALED
ncbi:MAG: hypothetical protein RL219_1788 [Actinomycetota bacterium]|jgi:aquaporin Z